MKTFRTWLSRRKQPKPAPPPSLQRLVGTTPTSFQWRTNHDAVGVAAKTLATPEWRQLLAILEAEAPIHVAPVPHGTPTADIVRAYYFQLGYDFAVRKLLSLAEPIADPEPDIMFTDDTL